MTNSNQAIQTVNVKAKAPWIGAGKSGSWTDINEAMEICGLNFEVESRDVEFHYDDNGMNYYDRIPGFQATVRSDTHKALGCVSDTYQIVQNNDVFTMLTPFIDAGGHIVAGGMTGEGLCFMVVEMGIKSAGGDDYQINVMATNSFNGHFPASIIWSPVRIICQNMYRSLCNHSDNIARFRHSLNVYRKLDAMKAAYDMFLNMSDHFTGNIETLKGMKAKHSIEEVVEFMFPYSKVSEDSSMYQTSRDRVDERRAFYINHYYNSDTNSDFGSCFALVNAYYDYISHDVPVRKTEDEYTQARLSKIVGGTMVKQKLMTFMCESK